MRRDSSNADRSVALASARVAGAGADRAGTAVSLPRIGALGGRVRLPWPQVTPGPVAARLALAALLLCTLAVVLFATAGESILVPRAYLGFPRWESGPLHHIFGKLTNDQHALMYGFSGVVVAMTIAYGVVVAAVRTFSMRTLAIVVVVLHALLLLGPPLQLTDLFNYLGYARLGALHHLNPYTHVMDQEIHDPVFRFTSWHHLRSPYGPLFTAGSYPLAFMSLPVAYWTLKVITVLTSLGFIALVWQCARQLGRDPRFAVAFVALNPIYLMYAVAGFHNDFFMLVPSTAAISLLLARRDRSAGAVLMLAVAVKFTAVLLLPFLLLAGRTPRRRWHIVQGAVLGAVPLAAMSLALFGLSLPNLVDQSTLLTDFSIPNLVGWALGLGGGTPGLLRVASVALIVTIALLLRRRRGWIEGTGWSTLALIASLAWLMPWYVIWLLPLAAFGTSVRLRRAAVALTVFLVITFIPITSYELSRHNINTMSGPPGQASSALQHKLEQ